jgi:glycerophosphoryl diester phosphodiesterase
MTEVQAHRGASAVAPENTLPAFQAALDMGVAGIEMDVQCTRDGALVLIHDFTLDRTTDGHGKVAECTLAEMRTLDAGSHFAPEFTGTVIPTLDEVLDLVGDRCRLNIEIKTASNNGGKEVDLVAAQIAGRNLYERAIVSSFNPIALMKMHHVDPSIQLGLIYRDLFPQYLFDLFLGPMMRPAALHAHYALIDETYIARARVLGKAVNAWTVNEVDEALRLQRLGVDTIISDVPDQMMAGLADPVTAL